AALGLWLFARAWLDGDRRALAGWSATAGLALATHYFAAFYFAPQAVWLLYAARRGRGTSPAAVGAAFVLPGLAALALAPLAWQQRHNPSGIEDASLPVRLVQLPKQLAIGFAGP